MDGFVVTPTTASSRIICSSAPDCSIVRESESIQTDWPRLLNSWSLDSAIAHLPFHGLDFFQTCDISRTAVEPGAQECAHELGGQARADDFRPEANHVHVIVLDALMRRVGVVTDRRADPTHLARRNCRADARAADEDAALGIAAEDRLAELPRLVGIVDPDRVRIGAEIDDVVPVLLQRVQDAAAQVHAPVVERSGNDHPTRVRSAVARATMFSTV